MKTKDLCIKVLLVVKFFLIINCFDLSAQERLKLGVISMDTKGLSIDNQTMTSLVHLELEKANVYEVLDRYDVADMVKKNGIDVNSCFGKSCLVSMGELLGAELMLSGSAEKFGNKIVFIFRLIDVKNDKIIKTDVMEYIDQQDQIQTMVGISLNNIIGKENERILLDLLVNYDLPITTARTTLNLNGPRVGFTVATGMLSERMRASKSDGGFNMFYVSNVMGYQYEKQFLSAGGFQALFEVLPMVSGLESGMFIPSLTCMLGFRFNKTGLEFGLGPVFRINKVAYGYYDDDDNWHLRSSIPYEDRDGINFIQMLDSRGSYRLNTGMIFAFGKTFRSGYLNMPVNIYVSPQQHGTIIGIMLGFNVANSPLIKRPQK